LSIYYKIGQFPHEGIVDGTLAGGGEGILDGNCKGIVDGTLAWILNDDGEGSCNELDSSIVPIPLCHKQEDCADDRQPEGPNEEFEDNNESQENKLNNKFAGNDNQRLYEEDMIAWNHNYVQRQRERRFMKWLVFFSAVFIILSSLLMCTKG
jgi:hypothetical protein